MLIDKEEVRKFFDDRSDSWDSDNIVNINVVNEILDMAEIGAGSNVLDVACGTGVLVPFYIGRQCASVTCADIAQKMIDRAAEKYHDGNISFVCCDAECCDFERMFDRIIIYNAFPHFSSPEKLFANLSRFLNMNGIIAVAHGASREAIDGHHRTCARKISNGLMEAEKLGDVMSAFFKLRVTRSDDSMYFVSGQKE